MNDLRRKQANLIYCIIAWGLLGGSLLVSVAAVFAPDFVGKYVLQLSSLVTLLAIMLPTMLYIYTKDGAVFAPRFSLASVRHSIWMIVPMAVAGFFAFTGLNGLITVGAAYLGLEQTSAAVDMITGESSPFVVILLGSLLPGIIEESFFRGVLLPAYEDKGATKAVLISAILFATLHGDPIALTAQFGLGVLLGYIAVRTRSVFPGMLYHALHNGITFGYLMFERAMVGSEEYDLMMQEALSAQNLPTQLLSSALMCAIGALALAVLIRIFNNITQKELARDALHSRAAAISSGEGTVETAAVKDVYLPLIIGVIAALILNGIGVVSLILMQ